MKDLSVYPQLRQSEKDKGLGASGRHQSGSLLHLRSRTPAAALRGMGRQSLWTPRPPGSGSPDIRAPGLSRARFNKHKVSRLLGPKPLEPFGLPGPLKVPSLPYSEPPERLGPQTPTSGDKSFLQVQKSKEKGSP